MVTVDGSYRRRTWSSLDQGHHRQVTAPSPAAEGRRRFDRGLVGAPTPLIPGPGVSSANTTEARDVSGTLTDTAAEGLEVSFARTPGQAVIVYLASDASISASAALRPLSVACRQVWSEQGRVEMESVPALGWSSESYSEACACDTPRMLIRAAAWVAQLRRRC